MPSSWTMTHKVVSLDMPGYAYGMTDKMQEIDGQTYNELDVDACKHDDPRMQVEPSGIAWMMVGTWPGW